MLQATPLDIAFTTMIIPSDVDADIRHRRRERIPSRATDDVVVAAKTRARPRRPRSDAFELECDNPVTDMSNGGPRCGGAPRRAKRTPSQCPHCMQALVDRDDETPTVGLPFASSEPGYPNSRLVDDILNVQRQQQPVAAAQPASLDRRTTWRPQSHQPSSIFNVADSWPFNQVKPEVFYAILVILGLLVILNMDSPRHA